MSRNDFLLPNQIQTNAKLSFQVGRTGIQALKPLFFKVPERELDEPLKPLSPLGTPVYDDVTFIDGSYYDLEGVQQDYKGIKLLNVMVVANRTKKIVKTAIQGRNQTVKEYVSAGDYTITISGQINANNNVFPDEEMRILSEITDANAPLAVLSTFLNEYLNVRDIIIESHSFRQVKGSRNSIDVTIQALSDVPIDFTNLQEVVL